MALKDLFKATPSEPDPPQKTLKTPQERAEEIRARLQKPVVAPTHWRTVVWLTNKNSVSVSYDTEAEALRSAENLTQFSSGLFKFASNTWVRLENITSVFIEERQGPRRD